MKISLVFLLTVGVASASASQSIIPRGLGTSLENAGRFKALGFAHTTLSTTTCAAEDFSILQKCSAMSTKEQCNSGWTNDSYVGCKWTEANVWDETSCVGRNGACQCGTTTQSVCLPDTIDCELHLVTKTGNTVCYKSDVFFVNGDAATIKQTPPPPEATPVPTPPPEAGICDMAQVQKYMYRCIGHGSQSDCIADPECLWCSSVVPGECSLHDTTCANCELKKQSYCMTSNLHCKIEDSQSLGGHFCYNSTVEFNFNQCPNAVFEGPGVVSPGESPIPTPDLPSPSPGTKSCSERDIERTVLGCDSFHNQTACAAADPSFGCQWCSLPALSCDAVGNQCMCSPETYQACYATNVVDSCEYDFESEVDGLVCAEVRATFARGACPTLKWWIAGKPKMRGNKKNAISKARNIFV